MRLFAALWLAGQYSRLKGNRSIAAGWVARCERLLTRAKPSAETGRVILIRALATNDPAAIEVAAERAMEIARQFGDSDYEALALAYSGLAMLSLGAAAVVIPLAPSMFALLPQGGTKPPLPAGACSPRSTVAR